MTADADAPVSPPEPALPIPAAAPAPAPEEDLSWLRVLAVHAHPDDETILTGGTLALLAARGAQVTNLTCTLGEEGEVIGARWQGLAAGAADQLGGYRAAELWSALTELGIAVPRFLGGAGVWRDSGMAGSPSQQHPRAFSGADRAHRTQQENQLAATVRELRPHLVITYDPVGWYGHPDHIRAHEITHAALVRAVAATAPDAGDGWAVPRLAWVVVPLSVSTAAAEPPATPTEDPLRPPVLGELPGWPDEELTHAVPVDAAAAAARARALACHATQVQLHPPLEDAAPTHLALSNHILQPLGAAEYYVAADCEVSDDEPRWSMTAPPVDPDTLLPPPPADPLPLLWDGLEQNR